MKEFIVGFLTCWILLGTFEVVSEYFDWFYKKLVFVDNGSTNSNCGSASWSLVYDCI